MARRAPAAAKGADVAQMTRRVIRVDMREGDEVDEGQVLLIIEATKTENDIAAPMFGHCEDGGGGPGGRALKATCWWR